MRAHKEIIPILTVAIPTYNRCRTLEKILNQLEKEKNQGFQILISDNNSSDDTELMVKTFQKRVQNITYARNTQNVGYSENFLKLYEMAKTRYIWFLADDETILPGAINNILATLISCHPVVAVFNHYAVDPYGKKWISGVSRDILHSDINKFHDYRQILKTHFISIIVAEKRLSIDAIKGADYKNNIFIQLTLVLLLLSDKFLFCESAFPIVLRNSHSKYGEFFKFVFVDSLSAVFLINHKFDNNRFIRESKKNIFWALQLYLSQKLNYFKFHGRPSRETIKQIIRYHGLYSIFIACFPVLYYITPAFLLKFVYFIQLVKINGYKKAAVIYNHNLNRVLKNKTSSGFINNR